MNTLGHNRESHCRHSPVQPGDGGFFAIPASPNPLILNWLPDGPPPPCNRPPGWLQWRKRGSARARRQRRGDFCI